MTSSIYNNFIHLDYCISSLAKREPNEFFIKKVNEILDQLEWGISATTINLVKELSPILTHLSGQLASYSMNELKDRMTKIQERIDSIPSQKLQTIPRSKIEMKWMVFLDIDVPDTQGALAQSIDFYLNCQVPFITSRSIMSCHRINDLKERIVVRQKLEKSFLESQHKWTVYQKGEFLVFLPEKYANTSLESLDLASRQTFRKITPLEAFLEPEKCASIDDYVALFSPTPTQETLFYIEGHGIGNCVIGLSREHYVQILEFKEKRKCKGLIVHSCHSGGLSSLISQQVKNRSYPIFVRSIGDFIVSGGLKAEKKIDQLFEQLTKCLNHSAPTIPVFRNLWTKLEEGDEEKYGFNLVKVNFSSQKGYQPLEESHLGLSLTFILAKQKQLLNQPIQCNRSYIHLHPQVIAAPIEWKGNTNYLHSLIPGNGRHLLKSIYLDSISVDDFIKKMIAGYDSPKLVCKGFFIGSIKDAKGQLLNEVVIYITPSCTPRTIFKKNSNYYLTNGETTSAITPFQHALFVKDAEKTTCPTKEGIASSTGGQEEVAIFTEALRTHLFYAAESESLKFLLDLEDSLKNPSEVLNWIDKQNLKSEDHAQLALIVEDLKVPDLALKIYEKYPFNPDVKNFGHAPLINIAVFNKNLPLIKALIKDGVNINLRNPLKRSTTPLHFICQWGDQTLLDLLLASKDIDFTVKHYQDGISYSPLVYALPYHHRLFQQMMQIKPTEFIKGILECLKDLISNRLNQKLDVLLQFLSYPFQILEEETFLTRVFQDNDLDLFDKLRKTIQIIDENGRDITIASGIKYAALYSSAETFNKLYNTHKNNPVIEQNLKYAYFSGNHEKIKTIENRELFFTKEDIPLLNLLLNRYRILNKKLLVNKFQKIILKLNLSS